MKPLKTPKPERCIVCKNEYVRIRLNQIVCGANCAIKYSKSPDNKIKAKVDKAIQKIRRQEYKKQKEKLKTRSEHLKEAQIIFNEFIRLRDKNEPCISCGTLKPDIQYHAGHFKSVGAHRELRFNEFNCHKQCSRCNNHLSGNLNAYKENLILKIGIEKVEELEKQCEPKKYTIEEIKELKQLYKLKIKELKVNQA